MALRSPSPGGGARDDDEAGKVRRARREAARHVRATDTRRSPRLHKPSRPGGATPRRVVPQPLAAPRARGASGRRAPRALAPHGRAGRSGLFLRAPSSALSAKGAPARCKVLSRPGGRHPRDGGGNGRSALRSSASLPGGQTPRAGRE